MHCLNKFGFKLFMSHLIIHFANPQSWGWQDNYLKDIEEDTCTKRHLCEFSVVFNPENLKMKKEALCNLDVWLSDWQLEIYKNANLFSPSKSHHFYMRLEKFEDINLFSRTSELDYWRDMPNESLGAAL